MKNWSMRILTTLTLLMISSLAFADNSIHSGAVAKHTDLSLSFLAQVFGTVGNSLQGTSGQMLGMLFYKFNQGILVVAGFWLSYLVFTTFLKSAHEGSFISPNRNIVIILLRVALGFGMLLPNPATGYSIFQDILMKVVVSGVSLADQTWSYGLKYLDNGGQVWRDPVTANSGTDIVTATQANSILGSAQINNPNFSSLGVGQQIFVDEVCMYSAGNLSTGVIEDDKNGQFIFPGATQNGTSSSGCGSVKWLLSTPHTMNFAKQGATAMVYDLLPAAKRFVCANNPTASGCSGQSSDPTLDIGNAFFNSLLGYANAVMPATQQQGNPEQASRAFIKTAKAGGWMLAGRYYWDLAQVSSNYQVSKDITSYLPKVIAPGLLPSPGQTPQNTQAANAMNDGMSALGSYTSTAMTLLSNYTAASSAGTISPNSGPSSTGLTRYVAVPPGAISNMPGVVAALLWPYQDGLNGIVANFGSSSSGYSYDPIVFLHNIGMRCLSLAGAIWITTSVVVLGLSAATIFCQSMVNLNSILQAVVSWVKPFLMMMAVVFLGIGFTLGYYVPLYPYMLFTFGVIGWIIRVIVGMAAAPLVCLSLTHPEGHDFLGIAQQLLQLLLSVFIEPVLMVIGLFGGMILSYVSLRILVYTFSGFISDLFGQALSGGPSSLLTSAVAAGNNFAAQNVGGPLLVYLTFPILLIIFAAIVYTVTNKCFSLIHELPGAVMNWIGGPNMQSTAGQMADAIGGVVSQAGQKMGQGMSSGDGIGKITDTDGKQVFVTKGAKGWFQAKKESNIDVSTD